jgi:hypothetical protein
MLLTEWTAPLGLDSATDAALLMLLAMMLMLMTDSVLRTAADANSDDGAGVMQGSRCWCR